MQRRAAAVYAAFFIVLSVGAYAMIGVAQQPSVSVENPAFSKGSGETLTVAGRTYTVSEISAGTNEGNDLREATLAWTNRSARYTATIENNTTVPPTDVRWEDQTARRSAVLSNETTITYRGNESELVVAGGEDPTSFTLRWDGGSAEFGVGDEFTYEGNRVTVVSVTPQEVTLVWGEPYRVLVPNASDPSTVTFRQEFNVSARLHVDPAVEDETVTRADGRRYVVYRANGTTRPLEEYLPDPERERFSEGDALRYQGNETTIGDITPEAVPVAWTAPRTNTVSMSEGDNVTLNGQRFVAHFPDNRTLELSRDIDGYQRQLRVIDQYDERINGLWGVSILSGLAAVLVLGMAYMPSRY